MLPRVLKGFTAYIDGRNYIGRAESVKLPPLSVQVEDFRGAGMDAPIEIDMGMEKLDVSVVLADYDAEVVKLFGLFGADKSIVLRGAIQRQGEDAVPVIIRLQGGIKQIDRDDWSQGKRANMTVMANCNKYSEEINGERVVDIDLLNGIRIIDGIDQLASMRAALGV
jgi:P2 family phage contractile tail tube protein